MLEADAQPPVALLEELAHHKTQIVAFLTATGQDWSACDWHDCYSERAAIAEFDGGLSRTEAETLALEYCLAVARHAKTDLRAEAI